MTEIFNAAQSVQQLVVNKGPAEGSILTPQELDTMGFFHTYVEHAVMAMKCLAPTKTLEYQVVELPCPDIKTLFIDAQIDHKEKPSPCGSCRFGPPAIILDKDPKKQCLIIEAICSKD